ncbi:hypothetical protein [Streptomyces sp. NPDC047315]|uniref:hypothetical protein n=1 Tax=Streptomyces sp. NPDC047315 TaxID=3155142 RepID=UPI0033EF4267
MVLAPGGEGRTAAARGSAFADDLMAAVAEQVAPYQRVRRLFVVDALPVTDTGKVQKTVLRERFADAVA